MNQLLADKRMRYLLIAVLVVVLVLGLLNIISTAFSLFVPLAIIAVGGFAFYKVALEGRDSNDVMEDEVAETTSLALDAAIGEAGLDAHEADENEARQRLSAVERARSDFLDSVSPAEEILDQIKSRKRRLTGDEDG